MLWLHAFCGYPSYQRGTDWAQSDYDAYKFVMALKGEPINKWATIKALDGRWRRISREDPEPAFGLFGEWAADRIRKEGLAAARLISIPSSKCVRIGTDAKGRKLCDAIAAQHPGMVVTEAFCWRQAWPSARNGGERDPDVLTTNLLIRKDLPNDLPIILVDDVATSHGHLTACTRALRRRNHTVALALVGGQTVKFRPIHSMFAYPPIDLDAA